MSGNKFFISTFSNIKKVIHEIVDEYNLDLLPTKYKSSPTSKRKYNSLVKEEKSESANYNKRLFDNEILLNEKGEVVFRKHVNNQKDFL